MTQTHMYIHVHPWNDEKYYLGHVKVNDGKVIITSIYKLIYRKHTAILVSFYNETRRKQQGVINIFIDYIIYFHSSIWAIFSSSFSFALLLLCRDLVQYLLTWKIDFRSIKCGAKKINFHLCVNKQEKEIFSSFIYLH